MIATSGIRRGGLLVLSALLVCGCGGGSTNAPTTLSSPVSSSAPTTASAAATATGTGMIASVPFAATTAFAQYDTTQNVWWIVVGLAGHDCTDVNSVSPQIVSAVRPNIDASFPAATPAALPTPGPQANAGITFQDKTGYPNTISGTGTSITISHADPAVGQHWTGRITVTNQSFAGKTYAFTGTFTATVCKPTNG
jgi:hypothetical protein